MLSGRHFLLLSLRDMQHTQLQKIKVGASIPLPLDGFETIDMAFDRSITPPIREGGCDRCILLTQAYSRWYRRTHASCMGSHWDEHAPAKVLSTY